MEKFYTPDKLEVMTPSEPNAFLRVLRGLLRPLVRTLISRGVTAPAFYRLLKSVYVDVAYREFRIDGDTPPTDSRVSLLTGVHRRDVRAYLSDPDDSWETARAKTATFATVLGQWLARPELQDDDGRPAALPRTSADGPDFERLVQSVSRDIRPRTVLDELMRQALVIEGEDGLLRIADGAVLGAASDDHKTVFFAANVGDHLAAAAENLLSKDPPFLERAVFYNRLSPVSVDRIEEQARKLSQAALEALNSESSKLQQADKDTTGPLERYRYGVYFYREPAVPADGASTKDDASETD